MILLKMNVQNFFIILVIVIAVNCVSLSTAPATDLTLKEMDRFIEQIENVTSVEHTRSKRQTANGATLPIAVIPPALVQGQEVASAIQFQRFFYPFIEAAIIGPYTFS